MRRVRTPAVTEL
jgi:hypothetical protein